MIEAVSAVNDNVIVVLSTGSVVEMPWFDKVKGIVHGYLGGQAGASAMLRVLTGECNPSGKLNETYPYRYEDTPAYAYYPSKERSSEYRESLFVSYRYYTTVGKEVRFPFGYGLSYTTFAYSNLLVERDKATFTVKNAGDCDGVEIAQLYVGCKSDTVFRPVKELKGFVRVPLKAGEVFDITIYADGDEIVHKYRAQFDIILMDVEMKFMDGMSAAEEIRKVDTEVVIIFITNHADFSGRWKSLGVHGYYGYMQYLRKCSRQCD